MHQDIEQLLAQPFGSLPELIAQQAVHRPHHTALVLDGRSLDFTALCTGMDRVATSLQQGGLRPGDVVALCAGTSIEYVLAYLGALRAGVAVAPLAPSATAEHLSAMLDNCGARLVLRDREVAAQWPLHAGAALRCVALDDAPEAGEPWSLWLAPGNAAPAPIAPAPDWPFNVIYSSGTTGVPKGIVQSWAMRWAHVRRAVINGYGPDAVSLCATPLYSNTTLVAALPTLALGGTLVLMRKFDAARYLALAEQHGATHTMLVPVQYQRLMACPDFNRTDLSRLQHKFCTSAPFSATLKAEVLRRWPGRLIEYYGMTEGGVRCELHCHDHPTKLHTVGRPGEGADIRFIDEQGRELPLGEQGEIVGRSAGMMSGYYRLPDKTREAEWFDAEGRRYIRSGDVGRLDADGFIVLGDRKKDMIITGGFNVYPSDIESVLCQHPQVAECAVVGVPSEQWGETPVAYVVPLAGTQPTAAELRDWLNARVGKTQRVADLQLTERLPRSEIGKVLKRTLREQYLQTTPVND
ncbi:class I adenylate-forming enzyme family protein [Acidovorax radicis]|uniref:class I adenylate-forming enzyme family protein n=1 Tax=Acidovorax radicis TaxID=758826 RepID=UPI001CF88BC4|nr:class I adenylate-forming enzyme family protein [Acidovorax radicis]UCU99424.1 acyl--CoA ligase [Acidovorax radicis]